MQVQVGTVKSMEIHWHPFKNNLGPREGFMPYIAPMKSDL